MTGGVGVRNKVGGELVPTDPTDICAGDTDRGWILALVGVVEVDGSGPTRATE